MADDTKNNDNPEFDEEFDDIEFDTTDDIDDGSYDELSDPESDIDFDVENDDLGEEEWAEEEPLAAPTKADKKKAKKEKRYDDGLRKPLMSFNTMVILGAFLVGASVLAYTVMSKTAEQNAGKKSVFRSMLNIGAVMDGGVFGDSKKDDSIGADNAPAADTTAAAPTGEQGFLDNPDTLKNQVPAVTEAEGTPPQPSPIASPETTPVAGEPLTPMPNGADANKTETVPAVPIDAKEQQTPRTPDEYIDAGTAPVTPDQTAVSTDTKEDGAAKQSAADLLKEAMANHQKKAEQKEGGDKADAAKEEPVIADATPPAPQVKPADKAPPVPVTNEVDNASAKPQPAPAASGPSPEDVAKLKAAQTAADAANQKASDLQKQVDSLTSQVDALKGQLTSAKSNSSTQMQDLQQKVQDLQSDLKQAKADAAAKLAAVTDSSSAEPKPAPAPKKKAAPKKTKTAAAKPRAEQAWGGPSVYPAPSSAAQWELRAAQPGRAWVSKPGARDMQGVTVGQTLPGIGTITAINYQNGRWTVQGTQGQILQ